MNPHLLPLLLGKKSLAGAVIAILRKYGTDAHVYLPGIGVINGLTAGNYLDSAGTTAATVDNPVGLVLDGAGSVGAELISNGDFSGGTTGWAASSSAIIAESSGSLVVTRNTVGAYPAANQTLSGLTIGKSYKFTATFTNPNTLDVYFGFASFATVARSFSTSGTLSCILVATATSHIVQAGLWNASGSIGQSITFDNISVKEVTGIHAIQATTANKMILRSTSGRYWWDAVDGTDLLSITFPAGYESSTTVDAAPTGQATLTAQNIVGAYAINTDTYGRFVFKNITASELAAIQQYANRLAGV